MLFTLVSIGDTLSSQSCLVPQVRARYLGANLGCGLCECAETILLFDFPDVAKGGFQFTDLVVVELAGGPHNVVFVVWVSGRILH